MIGFFSDQVEGTHEEEKTSVVIDNIWLYSFTAARITRRASPANNLGEKLIVSTLRKWRIRFTTELTTLGRCRRVSEVSTYAFGFICQII